MYWSWNWKHSPSSKPETRKLLPPLSDSMRCAACFHRIQSSEAGRVLQIGTTRLCNSNSGRWEGPKPSSPPLVPVESGHSESSRELGRSWTLLVFRLRVSWPVRQLETRLRI